MLKSRALALVALTSGALVATPASANYASITGAVDWTAVSTALFAVAALLAAVFVVRKGIRFVLGMLK